MISCLLAGMDNSSHKQVNYDKIKEVTQNLDENPILFSYTLNGGNDQIYQFKPSLPRRLYFISPSPQNIPRKLQKLEEGPQTLQQILVNMAFNVFNNRGQEAKQLKDKNTHTKYQMLASILQNQMSHPNTKNPPKGCSKQPTGACCQCGNPGHWTKACPNPHPLTKPCPQCGQWGYWKMNCKQGKQSFLSTWPQIPDSAAAENPSPMFPLDH
jgi:hypothetical protein